MDTNIHLISRNELIRLILNQGEFRKFYVILGEDVLINFKHIRPRKRKGDKVDKFHITNEGIIINFD